MQLFYKDFDIFKKKKIRFDNLVFSSIENILIKAKILQIIDSYFCFALKRVKCDQNSIQIIQSKLAIQIVFENLYINLSISRISIQIVVFNRIEKYLLQTNKIN